MSICYVFYYLYNVHKNQATQHRIFNSQQSEKVTKLALRDLKHTSSFNILISFEILDFQIPSSYLTSFRTDSLQDFPGFKGKKKKREHMSLLFFSKMRFCKNLLLWYRRKPTKWKKWCWRLNIYARFTSIYFRLVPVSSNVLDTWAHLSI